jgi:hypothetical protein
MKDNNLPDGQCWKICPAGTLLTAVFDGQTVAYHTGAGHTYWISPVAAEVLSALAAGINQHASLHAHLSQMVDADDMPLLDESLRETLEHLSQLNLIETQ